MYGNARDLLAELVATVELIQKIIKDVDVQLKDHEERIHELEYEVNFLKQRMG